LVGFLGGAFVVLRSRARNFENFGRIDFVDYRSLCNTYPNMGSLGTEDCPRLGEEKEKGEEIITRLLS